MQPLRSWPAMLMLLFVAGFFAAPPSFAGQMHQDFVELMNEKPRDEHLPGLVALVDQVDIPELESRITRSQTRSRAHRHELVINTARELAARTQADLLIDLEQWKTEGRVRSYRSFWIVNAFYVEALPEVFELLAARYDVEMIYEDREVFLREGMETGGPEVPDPPRDELPTNLVCINLQPVWDLGIRGQGRLVSTMDSGAEGTHEAFGARWRGHEQGVYWWEAWFDPYNNTTFPEDVRYHGTHVMGILTGQKPDGTPIGVAPEAHWICAAATVQWNVSKVIECYEWIVDPDGNPGTLDDVPDVVNCSWGYTTDCSDILWEWIDLVEAAGIVSVIAVDNTGPAPMSVNSWESRAVSPTVNWGVGNVNSNLPDYPIYNTSGRGPSPCDSVSIKPNVTAPGTDIYSCNVYNGYRLSTGTSMAAPHVSGACALLRQVDPDITVEEIKQLLMATAVDKGDAGADNTYGWGIINVGAAVDSLRSTLPRPAPTNMAVASVTADTISLQWNRPVAHPYNQPVSYRLYRASFDAEFPDTALAEIVDSVTVATYVDSGVPFDSLKYMVTAVYDHGESAPSNQANVFEEAWMIPPINLTTSADADTVSIGWDRPEPLHPDNQPDLYRLYRAPVGEAFGDSAITEVPDSAASHGYIDHALPSGIYRYAATAVYGTVESDTSVNAFATIYPRNPPEDLAVSLGPGGVQLQWSRPSVDPGNPLESYRIYRALFDEALPDTALAEIVDTLATVTFVDSAAPFDSLRYAVRAVYETAPSDTSNHAVVTEQMWYLPPTNLAVTSIVADRVGLAWQRPVPVHPDNPLHRYRLFRAPWGEDFGVDPIAEITDSLGVFAYTDSGVPFDSLRYAVTAVYEAAESDTSNHAVITPEAWMPAPSLAIASVRADTVGLEWTRPEAIHPDNPMLLYRLFRAPGGEEFGIDPIAEVADTLGIVSYADPGVPFDSLRYAVTALYQADESDTSNHVALIQEDWMQRPHALEASVSVDTVRLEWERPEPVHPDNPLLLYRLFRTQIGKEFGAFPIAEITDSLGVFAYVDSGVPPDSHLYAVTALYEAAETELSENAMAVVYHFGPPESLTFWASADSITLQWERPDTVDTGNALLLYRLYRAPLGEQFGEAPLAEIVDPGEVVQHIDPDLALEDYHYAVTALYETTESGRSNEVEVLQDVWLSPPQNVMATVVADTATIFWERPASVHPDNLLQLYRVFRAPLGEELGVDPIAEFTDSSAAPAYVDPGLAFTDYHYVVTALYELAESDTSNHVEITRQATWSSPPPNLTLASVVDDTVHLSWEKPAPIHPVNQLQYYRVFRARLGEEFGIDPIAEVTDSSAVAAYTDPGLDYDGYHYVVTAQYDSLESDASNDLEVPEQTWWPSPVDLIAWAQSDTVHLQWGRPEPIHPDNRLLLYRVYRALAGEPFPAMPTYSVFGSSAVVEYLDLDVGFESYHYVVSALYVAGESGQSNEAEVTVYRPEDVEESAGSMRMSLQIMPNPFNPVTTIHYTAVGTAPLRLAVYSVAGRRVRTLVDSRVADPGRHMIDWNGTDQKGRAVASGIYLLRLEQANQSLTRRLILLK